MRVFKPMSRWLSAGIFVLVLLLTLIFPANAASDTGTYQISNYIITLEPQSSGQVKITFEQEWKVLSGDIPWITISSPNSNFSIGEFGEAASKISKVNSGGFIGIRVDLDKDYLPGQSFKIKAAILQNNMLERLTNEKKWRVSYTPGWYDNAVTDHLQINLVSPVELKTYSLISPQPTSTNNNVLTWEKLNVPGGGKFPIKVECLDGGFLVATTEQTSSNSIPGWIVVLLIVIALIIIYLLIALAVRRNRQARDAELKARIAATEKEMAENKARKKEIEKGFEDYVDKEGLKPDSQGRYYDRGYGGYISPAIWAAVILSHHNQTNPSVPPGQNNPSCACACVACACACACACAGGGAAGCSKKTLHQCPECLKSEKPTAKKCYG